MLIMSCWLYMLRCADGNYYVGTTRDTLQMHISQHNDGTFDGYTATRRPVALIFSQEFEHITDAIAAERQLKGWSRAKKEALAGGDWTEVSANARRRAGRPHPSRLAARALQDEDQE